MLRNIACGCVLAYFFSGCADMKYPGWQNVAIVESVYGKPCEYKEEEEIRTDYDDDEDEASDLRKNAIAEGGNTVVMHGMKSRNKGIVSYFKCAPGLKPFKEQPSEVWMVKDMRESVFRRGDYDRSVAKCTYEVHKATIITAPPTSTRAVTSSQYYMTPDPVMNLNNAAIGLSNTLSQISAAKRDEENIEEWKSQLDQDKKSLYDECLKVDGFALVRSNDKKDLATLNKQCPNQDNAIAPCLLNTER